MKNIIALTALLISTHAFADQVTCYSDKAIQEGMSNGMKVDAEIEFDLNRSTKEISNFTGHIFVQSPYADNEEISTENSYMGFFSINRVPSNPDYRPLKYKGYTQYKDINAAHTAGQENGMWGTFVADFSKADKFDARYIFQAGDHMGGTVIFTCRSNN